MRGLLLSIAVVFGMAGPASAGFITGEKLFDYCQAKPGTAKKVYCLGYIIGVTDAMEDPFISKALPSQAKVCMPNKLRSSKLKDVVVSYLERNPQERDFEAQALIIVALTQAYPCKTANPAPDPK